MGQMEVLGEVKRMDLKLGISTTLLRVDAKLKGLSKHFK